LFSGKCSSQANRVAQRKRPTGRGRAGADVHRGRRPACAVPCRSL